MNLTRDRAASIGWFTLLATFGLVTSGLMLRANAVKSQVQLAERQIVELKREKEFLETEYETRANQQQLSDLNEVDFGYKAPGASQYLEGERQLATLGAPRDRGAPPPIRMASADPADDGRPMGMAARIPAMVSPIGGKLFGSAMAAEARNDGGVRVLAVDVRNLEARLSRTVHHKVAISGTDPGAETE
jgi:hypothetical protein